MPLSALSALGIAKETQWAAGADPTINLPVEPFNINFSFDNIPDQSLRGEIARDFGIYQGVFRVDGDIDGHFYPEEMGYLLLAFFGSVTTTGTGPYEHTFSIAQSPPSLAMTDENGVQSYQYRGLYLAEFGFTFNAAEGLLDFSASLVGKNYTTTTATVPAATATNPFVGWMANVSLNDTTWCKVIEFEATLEREVTLVYTACNTQEAYAAYVGPMAATGSMTIVFDSSDDFDKYLENDNDKFEIEFVQGTGSDEKKFTFTANKMNYGQEPAQIQRDNVDLRLVLNWNALHNSTDNAPCVIMLANSTSTY